VPQLWIYYLSYTLRPMYQITRCYVLQDLTLLTLQLV